MGLIGKIKLDKLTNGAKEGLANLAQAGSEAIKKGSELTSTAGKYIDTLKAKIDTEKVKERVTEIKDKTSVFVKDKTGQVALYATEQYSVIRAQAIETWNDEKVVAFRQKSAEIGANVSKHTVKGLRVVTGIQAIHDRKASISTKAEADQLKADIEKINTELREEMNQSLSSFGEYRLVALKNTVGRFLNCLDKLDQRAKAKDYEFLMSIDLPLESIKELQGIDMKATDAIKTLAIGGSGAAAAVAVTPWAVTGAVSALATASTGTAISTLSGAAATNATLAWLGGGAISAGGGGVAAGTAVLGALTATAAVGVAVIAIGTLASGFYSRKYTEAEQYLADIKQWAAETESGWEVIKGIKARVDELQQLTMDLETCAMKNLDDLEGILDVFDKDNNEHVKTFQQSALLVKSMSELAQTAVLDENGDFNDRVTIVADNTRRITNQFLK